MRYLLGMSGYMRQTLQMYENGYTLERLVGLQTLMQQVGLGGAVGAAVAGGAGLTLQTLMQQRGL